MEIMASELTSRRRRRGSHADKCNRPSNYITSGEGGILRKEMWNEVVGVLEEKVPRVKDVVAILSKGQAI